MYTFVSGLSSQPVVSHWGAVQLLFIHVYQCKKFRALHNRWLWPYLEGTFSMETVRIKSPEIKSKYLIDVDVFSKVAQLGSGIG